MDLQPPWIPIKTCLILNKLNLEAIKTSSPTTSVAFSTRLEVEMNHEGDTIMRKVKSHREKLFSSWPASVLQSEMIKAADMLDNISFLSWEYRRNESGKEMKVTSS